MGLDGSLVRKKSATASSARVASSRLRMPPIAIGATTGGAAAARCGRGRVSGGGR